MKEDEKRNLLLNECVRYLKKSSAFQKVLAGFREKYRSLGHWGGTMVLKELSREERMDLGGFLAKDLLKKDDVRITASQMEKALSGTRFAELEWEVIEAPITPRSAPPAWPLLLFFSKKSYPCLRIRVLEDGFKVF